MEFLTLGLFAAALLACISLNLSILYALLLGYVLFFSYGLYKKFNCKEMLLLSLEGIKTVKTILLAFVFIGMLTASWRACGTIAMIIYSSSVVMIPAIFLLITFFLNCFVSVLTGTSFGTMATVGIICMTIGNIMGVPPAYLGGAVLSGIYFGDRCSPMSTSALLVSGLTHTDIFTNIRLMIRTAFIPFILTCAVYLGLGCLTPLAPPDLQVLELFHDNFQLHWLTLVPAALIIIFSLYKIKVIKTMAVNIIVAAILCYTLQDMSITSILQTLVNGYHASDPQMAVMMDGGGIVSMIKVGAIVCISSSYFGIFEKTGLLNNIQHHLTKLAHYITPFGGAIVTSALTVMISCNQSLAVMLTYQLCKETIPEPQKLAITLEDTAVVIAAMIPWSIAVAVVLETISAPTTSILFASYLYLLPLCSLIANRHEKTVK